MLTGVRQQLQGTDHFPFPLQRGMQASTDRITALAPQANAHNTLTLRSPRISSEITQVLKRYWGEEPKPTAFWPEARWGTAGPGVPRRNQILKEKKHTLPHSNGPQQIDELPRDIHGVHLQQTPSSFSCAFLFLSHTNAAAPLTRRRLEKCEDVIGIS